MTEPVFTSPAAPGPTPTPFDVRSHMLDFYDLSAELIQVAASSGALAHWAEVLRVEPGLVRLRRLDDGLRREQTVRTKDVRRALRRIARERAEDLGLEDGEVDVLIAAAHGASSVTPEVADLVVQIATMGSAQFWLDNEASRMIDLRSSRPERPGAPPRRSHP